jgi:hypothetical protein
MVVHGTWRDDACSSDTNGALGAEFVLHLASVLLYFCLSTSIWQPAAKAEPEYHDHDE